MAHKHKWGEEGWSITLEGPLRLRISCSKCMKSHWFQPRKRLRATPEGLTTERFQAYIEVAEDELLLEAFRARVVTADSEQMRDAYMRGIAPGLPTIDTIEAYTARTLERLGKREADPGRPACNRHPEELWEEQSPAWEAFGVKFPATYVCRACHPQDATPNPTVQSRSCDVDCIDEAIARHAANPSIYLEAA